MKRILVSPNQRKALVSGLRRNLLGWSFFKKLPSADPSHPFRRVRVFEFNGTKVAIKNTELAGRHGFNFKGIRKDLLAFHRARRKKEIVPEHYMLLAPKVYGRAWGYLIMEHVLDNSELLVRQNPNNARLIDTAREELADHLAQLGVEKKIKHWLAQQARHAIVAGIQNGKVVLYLPYDLNA